MTAFVRKGYDSVTNINFEALGLHYTNIVKF
jgi:hypothetical protein